MQVFLLDFLSVGNAACKSPPFTWKVTSVDELLCQLPPQLLQKDDSDKAGVGRGKKDLGGIWAGGKDQNIHIDRKSPPLALGWALIRVTVHITLEILGAASAAGDCWADLRCFYIAV